MDDLLIIAGLGNPGSRFDNTRHNIGFEAIDRLSEKYSIKISKLKFKALYGDGVIEGKRVLLVKPQTFMNLSGESLRELVEWYKIPMDNLLVVFDDVDLPAGKIRIRPSGSAGTHNGMRSIVFQLQKDNFPRVKIGIGAPPEGWDLADYVLSKFSPDDKKLMEESLKNTMDAITLLLKSGVDAAMNRYNSKG